MYFVGIIRRGLSSMVSRTELAVDLQKGKTINWGNMELMNA
jgi:hypothetical protein